MSWANRNLLFPWKKLQQVKKALRNEYIKEEVQIEKSPATQLITEALVTTTKKLHLPKKYIRNIRDDMTVIIVFFDKCFLRQEE